ncbi:MAG TPA: PASTA domain-containing protein, partial [Solirubrobacteraceae bacterium]
VGRRAIGPRTAAYVNSILEKVVKEGTGTRAALPGGRPVAGKTGTTENYGDAWFVGYTPQLATAVWVGYPDGLRPMLTEFHRHPVAGGTFPAQIWKIFTRRALRYEHDPPESFPAAPAEYATPKYVLLRSGKLELDNGICRGARSVWFFEGSGPAKTANCKPNEVEVPNVVGSPDEIAVERLRAQPLKPNLVFIPAAPRQRPGVVVRQSPKSGTLSASDTVTLFVAKSLHGVVPQVVGLPLARARRSLARAELDTWVVPAKRGRPGRVLFQVPKSGVAAAPGMAVKLLVAQP